MMPPSPTHLDDQLYHLIHRVKQWPNPSKYVQCLVREAPALEEGDVRCPPGAYLPRGRQDLTALATDLEKWTGIKTSPEIDLGYNGPVDLVLDQIGQPDTLCYHVAPWFAHWLCQSTLTPQAIKAKAMRIATQFHTKGLARFAYRGEHKCFPSVQSTMARHYRTSNKQAIALIVENQNREARRQSGQAKKMTDLDVQVAIQHLGGTTNLIDFSKLPWVALHFACTGADDEAGRLLGLDVSRGKKDFAVHHLEGIEYPIAKERLQNQLGVLIEPTGGMLADRHFDYVERIEAEEKAMFKDLLKKMGIERKTLFSDLVAYVQREQDAISMEAYAHIMAHHLREGAEAECRVRADHLVTQCRRDELNLRTALYYRGLANALLGRFEEANRDMAEAKRLFVGKIPAVVGANHRYILAFRGSKDVRRLRKKLDLTVDHDVWTHTLEGLRWVP